jgi:hypothetical protein
MKKSRLIQLINEEIQSALKERVFIDPSTDKGRDISLDAEGKPRFGTVASAASNAIKAITKSYPELKTQANIVAAFLLSAKARKQDEIVIKGMDFEVKPHIVAALEEFDKAVAAQEDAYEDPKSRATLEKLANAAGTGVDLSSYMDFIQSGRPFTPSLGGPQTQRFVAKDLGLNEDSESPEYMRGYGDGYTDGFHAGQTGGEREVELNEMAKIAGDLKSSIEKVINSNSDLTGLDLKKKIKSDPSVISALGDQTLHDNQLNKFIELTKGERELAQRGRKASTDKKEEPKKQSPKPSPAKKETPKKDDEDDDAAKSVSTDETAKELGNTPEDKKQKFNTGLKFIKKYKDDKSKVDAYLKKAKDEYKLPKSMLDDLKRTAGRDV